MCLMCLESQWRGVRMSAVSAPCQTCPRQKLDAKFKQGSKLNFNKPLTSFLLPLPETHNAWLDRQGQTMSSYKMLQLEKMCFKDNWMFLFQNDLLWAGRLTQSYRKTYLIVWRYKKNKLQIQICEHVAELWSGCHVVTWVCHVSGCCLKTVMTSWRDGRHPELSTMTRLTL